MALRGDPPEGVGQPFVPHPEGYQNAAELVAGIRRIGDFDISVAAYPEKHPAEPGLGSRYRQSQAQARCRRDPRHHPDVLRQRRLFPLPRPRARRRHHRADRAGHPADPLVQADFGLCGACGASIPGWLAERFEGLEDDPETHALVASAVAAEQVLELVDAGVTEFHFLHPQKLSLMVPLFDPGPVAHPDIPIHVAAVNPVMCRVAGEVADGLRPHPVCTPRYIREVMLPAAAEGAARAGREMSRLSIAMKPLICTAPDKATLAMRLKDVRARVAFYCSTPAYRSCFELHGLGALADEMAVLSKAQRWEEMPARINDEVLHLYATVGTYDEIGARLIERYAGLVTDCEFSIPCHTPAEQATMKGLLAQLKAEAA